MDGFRVGVPATPKTKRKKSFAKEGFSRKFGRREKSMGEGLSKAWEFVKAKSGMSRGRKTQAREIHKLVKQDKW